MIINNLKNNPFFLLALAFLAFIYFLHKQNMTINSLKKELIKNLDFYKTQQTKEKEELKQQLSLLREELIRYKAQQEGRDQILALTFTKNNKANNDVLSSESNLNQMISQADQLISTISANVKIKGIIKLKNSWLKAEVYSEPKIGAKILGEIIQNKLYFVYDEQNNWYKVEYQEGKFGWLQRSLVEQL